MRRWQLCFALSFFVSATFLPAADSAVSAEEMAGAIISGLLVDASERPIAGDVEVVAWPTGRPVEVGQTLQLPPVGHDGAAKDGRFAVTADLTPELAELARLNGGYINFVLQAAAGGLTEELHFSRYVGEGWFTAQEAQSGRANQRTEWRATPEDAAEPVYVRFQEVQRPRPAAQHRPIAPMQGGCWGLKLVESQVGDTVIGELRTPDDTVEASFAYGHRADSEIGVAQRGAQGPWSLSGSFHLANADDTTVIQRAGSGKHLLVRSRFKYDRYEYQCPSGRRERVVPKEWMGDVQAQPTAVRGCAGVPEDRLGRYGVDAEFDRVKEKAVLWEGAVNVFGASLTARSGYSRWVQGHWKFGGGPLHLLCGDDGPPKRAGRIFAGSSA